MFQFYTPWRRQKTPGFLTVSRDTEREHWPEMSLYQKVDTLLKIIILETFKKLRLVYKFVG